MLRKNFTLLEGVELSSADLGNLLGNLKGRLLSATALANVRKVETLLPRVGSFVVLFYETTAQNVGHWQCMFRSADGYHFWDSYGLAPSAAHKFVSATVRAKLKELKPYLPALISASVAKGNKWTYNNIDYQSWKGSVATCGRHVAVRLLHRSKTEAEYYAYLKQFVADNRLSTFDEAVTDITYNLIRK